MKEKNKRLRLLCEDWVLYDKAYRGVVGLDAATGQNFADIKEDTQSVRVFGTRKQIDEAKKRYNIDETYKYKIEKPGSYWWDVFADPEAHNKMVRKTLKEYKELYTLNNNELLIL
tara:strand:+ start:509 stop:853 length:345 start_codon:yes stop_codon:yes gene_type:complete